MNIYIMIATILANVIAIGLVYQFVKKMPKKEILIFVATSVALMYILISIVYWFSGFGIEKQIHEATKNFITYLFVPVNVILFIPYFAAQYRKLKEKKIKRDNLAKKMTIMLVLLVVVLVAEYFYFVNIQKNIKSISDENKQNIIQNEEIENGITNEQILNEETTNTEITNKETMVNETIVNEI